jgi:redox-sensitive bicupin YhaK (pirin superfamily)
MSDGARTIARRSMSKPTMEGAGVRLRRAFGFQETGLTDPFLLLDDFRSDRPEDYLAGFPWHPHRGIETVTYMLAGHVEHEDSLGNKGTIGAGDVQWMTAGSGIIHSEMPKQNGLRMGGFQLWVNLPASHKMMDPRYRDIPASTIPVVAVPGGEIRLVCGSVDGHTGPAKDIVVDVSYMDVRLDSGATIDLPAPRGKTAIVYVTEGDASFVPGLEDPAPMHMLLVFLDDGERVAARAGSQGARFLFLCGTPLGEPVAWYGPIVMNTREELEQAFEEFQNGTFIKKTQAG